MNALQAWQVYNTAERSLSDNYTRVVELARHAHAAESNRALKAITERNARWWVRHTLYYDRFKRVERAAWFAYCALTRPLWRDFERVRDSE